MADPMGDGGSSARTAFIAGITLATRRRAVNRRRREWCRITASVRPRPGEEGRMGSTIRCLVRRDTYRDSVELMRVAAELEQLAGVTRAALLMATPANRGLLAEAGLLVGEATAAGPNDLVVAVAASDEATAEGALAR